MEWSIAMIDPPWPQKKGGRRSVCPNQGRSLDYATMAVPDIFSLLDTDIFPHHTGSPTVFLWTIDKFLHDAEAGMLSRGWKLHARLIWNKQNGPAPAFTIRFAHEYLLWFYKSPMRKPADHTRGVLTTVFSERSRSHSRKPDLAYDMVSLMFPDGPKLDVFSREHRDGWAQYGDQCGFFDKGV